MYASLIARTRPVARETAKFWGQGEASGGQEIQSGLIRSNPIEQPVPTDFNHAVTYTTECPGNIRGESTVVGRRSIWYRRAPLI
jgi:hypothetical protein